MDQKLRLSLIFQAAGNATNYLRGVGKESDRTARAVKAARERVSELQRTTKDVGAYRAMEAALGGTRDKLAAAKAEALRLGQAMDAAENPTRQMTRAFEIQTGRVRALERQQEGQVRTLGDLKTKLAAAGVSTEALGAHERRLARDLGQANNALDEQTRKMKALQDRQASLTAARGRYDKTQAMAGTIMSSGASSMGAGAAILAPLGVVGNDAMTFEDAMLDVKKVVDFETPVQFAAMNRDILTLSENMPLIPEDIAKIVAAAGQAKIPRGELLGFAEDAGKMGVAFDTTAEDAGSKMATWRTAFSMTQPAVRALADQINYLGDNGNATALKISDVVTRIGPLGEIAGLAAGQIAALGSTIVGMGVNEEIAATGIKNTMLALTKGEAATKAQKEAYAALGLEATKVAKAMQVDASGTILDVMEKIQKLSPDRQASILTQLFGSESVAAIAPMLNQLDTLRDNFKAVGDATVYAGSMDKEFQNRMSGTATAVGTMKNGFKAAGVEIGTMFLPQINAVAAGLKGAAKWVRDFTQAHPGAVKVIGMLVAAIGVGLVVFGGLAMAVAAVLGPFALLQLALTQVGLLFGAGGAVGAMGSVVGKVLPFVGRLFLGVGRMALAGGVMVGRGLLLAGRGFLTFGAAAAKAGIMLLANPITWIILAIVAAVALLAGAAYLIIRNWGTIGPWLAEMWGRIRAFTISALQGMGSAILNFSPLGLIIRNWSGISGFAGRIWEAMRSGTTSGLAGVGASILSFSPLGLIIRNWSGISSFAGRIWEAMRSGTTSGLAGVGASILSFSPLGLIIRNWSGISGFVGRVWRMMRSGATMGLAGVGEAILSFSPLGLIIRNWSGISGFAGRIWEAMRSGTTSGLAGVGAAILSFSPLGLIIRNWSGISGFAGWVWEAMRSGATSGLAGVGAAILSFSPLGLIIRNWSGISGFVGRVWEALRSGTTSGLANVGGAILGFSPLDLIVRTWGGVSSYVGRVWQGVRAAAAAGVGAVQAILAGWSPLQAIQTAFASAFNWMSGLPARFSRIGSDIVSGLTRGIRGGQGAARAAAAEAAGQVEGGARRRLDTHSPSRVFASIGQDVMNGFGVGIAANLQAPIRTMRTAAAAVVAAGSMAAPALADPAAPRPTFETAPRLGGGAATRPAPAAPMVVNLTINAAPGMDEDRLVDLALQKLRSAIQPNGSGAFADDADSMGEAY